MHVPRGLLFYFAWPMCPSGKVRGAKTNGTGFQQVEKQNRVRWKGNEKPSSMRTALPGVRTGWQSHVCW